MGILKLDGANTMLKELCDRRPVASLPFAGRYRMMDFALSSMVNSGIGHVGVLLSEKARVDILPIFLALVNGPLITSKASLKLKLSNFIMAAAVRLERSIVLLNAVVNGVGESGETL